MSTAKEHPVLTSAIERIRALRSGTAGKHS